jgi:cation transport regulator ChaB
MPYNPDNPPDKVKNLPAKKQRQFVEVFNSCWEKHKDDEICHKMAWGVVKKASEEDVHHNDKYEVSGPCMCCADEKVARALLHIALDLQDVEPKIAMGLMQEVKALRLKSRVMDFYKQMRGFEGELKRFLQDLQAGVSNPSALREFPEVVDFISLEKLLKSGPLRHAYEPEQMIADKMLQVVNADA